MSTLTRSTGKWTAALVIDKQTSTLTLPTKDKYLDRDIELGIAVQSASGSVAMTAGDGNVTGSGCTLSTSDTSGVSVTGSGSVSAVAKVGTAGFTPVTDNFASGSAASSAATKYITGVTLTAPSSGVRSFAVTVPDGATTVTFTFQVDASGNVTII